MTASGEIKATGKKRWRVDDPETVRCYRAKDRGARRHANGEQERSAGAGTGASG